MWRITPGNAQTCCWQACQPPPLLLLLLLLLLPLLLLLLPLLLLLLLLLLCPMAISGTSNEVYDEMGPQEGEQYRYISVVQPLACPDLKCLKTINSISSEWWAGVLGGWSACCKLKCKQQPIRPHIQQRVTASGAPGDTAKSHACSGQTV
jgi:hypothetical protein